MAIFERYLIVTTICTAVGCMSVSDAPGPDEEVGVSRLTVSKQANPATPTLMPNAAAARPNVDSSIPFTRPTQQVTYTPVVSVDLTRGPVEGPMLPLGPDIQARSAAVAVVTCKAAPSLALDCPPEAPVPSTCTARENLPPGCQSKLVPGGSYPDRAFPACCP